MRIHFNRYRFRAGAEALFMRAARYSRGINMHGTNMDRILWNLKGWMTKIMSDKREERKDKRK
jgi:hypothetical protein